MEDKFKTYGPDVVQHCCVSPRVKTIGEVSTYSKHIVTGNVHVTKIDEHGTRNVTPHQNDMNLSCALHYLIQAYIANM